MIKNPPARLILDAFDEGLCLLDEAGALRAMNGAAERLTGYAEKELIGHRLVPKLEISSRKDDTRPAAQALDPSTPSGAWLDIRLRRKEGSKVDAVCAAYPLGNSTAGALLKLRPRESTPSEDVALRDIKVKLEAIFGGMADGLVVIDEGGKIQLFSAGAETLFGYRAEEALGANVKLLMPAPYRDAHDGYLSTYRETGVKKIIGIGREVSGRRKDGSTFPMYLSIGEIWLEGKRYFVGVTHDLTRLKRAEERLITLSAAVEQSPAAVMISNKEGRIEYVNNRFVHLTGYEADELIGQNPRLLQSNHTASELYRRLWETICSGSEWRGEIQDRKKSGELYWAQETITPLRDARGEITHFLAIQEDVTQQKQDKEALAESEQRFRHVAEMAGEWLWEQDPRGRYIYSSVAVRDILGLEPEEILGKSYLDLFAGEPPEHWMAELPSYSAENCHPFHRLVNHYRHKDGHDIYTEFDWRPDI